MQTLLFKRHPLPWTLNEVPFCGQYFVKDANDKTVTMMAATDETTEEHPNENDGVVSITTKRPRPGALAMARMIVALPDMLNLLSDANAKLSPSTNSMDIHLSARIEALLEKITD